MRKKKKQAIQESIKKGIENKGFKEELDEKISKLREEFNQLEKNRQEIIAKAKELNEMNRNILTQQSEMRGRFQELQDLLNGLQK